MNESQSECRLPIWLLFIPFVEVEPVAYTRFYLYRGRDNASYCAPGCYPFFEQCVSPYRDVDNIPIDNWDIFFMVAFSKYFIDIAQDNKPFFFLPGGPPSNEMAFLQLALPGLLKMCGNQSPPFTMVKAYLSQTVRGVKDWTQFIHAKLEKQKNCLLASPMKDKSRLQSMARKDALIIIPEGREVLNKGEQINVQLLKPYHQIFSSEP